MRLAELTPRDLSAVLWILFGFLAVMLAGRWLEVDFHLADALYRFQGDSWALRDAFIAEDILHRGGRLMSQFMGGGVIMALIGSFLLPSLRTWRRPLTYLFLAVTASTLTVSVIKHLVSMECPWDLVRYGGDTPFIGLFDPRPPTMPDTACFPAGHASAGYAWLALYFFLGATVPRWRWAGLGLGIVMGLVFGITQQLRGAHFLSHDLWTLMLCLSISFVLARLMLPTSPPIPASTDAQRVFLEGSPHV